LKILVACEFSGVVRNAFTALGHDATSCDILPSETPGKHIQDDVAKVLHLGWDMCIAHPPCTYLCTSGARWFYHPEDSHLPTNKRRPHPKYPNRWEDQKQAIDFFMLFANANINKIAIENPIGVMSTKWRKPNQIIQPWQFGHGETKATCLWLKNLPLLKPTEIVDGRLNRIQNMPETKQRGKLRSITYEGIAQAMATQWGK
jgi:hypothetical protein